MRRQLLAVTLMESSDGFAERTGRALGRALLRGRVVARQLSDPAVQERLLATGKSLAARHGPDVVEQAAQRVTDRALWGIAARVGFMGVALHQVRPATSQALGRLARGIAESVRRVDGRQGVLRADHSGAVLGSHLASGCIVRTTAEIVLVEIETLDFAREHDAATGLAELIVRSPG